MEGRDEFLWIAGLEDVEGEILVEEEFQPVEQFAGAGLFLEAGDFADVVEDGEGFADEGLLDASVDGEREKLVVDVTYDGKQFMWQVRQ